MAGAQSSLALLAFLGVLHGASGLGVECQQPASSSQTVYDFTVPNIYQNKNVSLSEYRGKVLVITNLASFWGLTPMHYLGYNALKQNFAGKQFEILGFPCDQFNLVCLLSYFCFFKLFRSYDFLWGGMFRWIFQFGQVMNYIVESQSFVDWHQANHSNQ